MIKQDESLVSINIKTNEILKGIFLIILALFGAYIVEIIGCGAQQLLSNNMLVKHIILFLLIYFTIDYSYSNSEHIISPSDNLQISFFIFILFVMFSRMNLFFTIIVFLLLCIIYILESYINYYKKIDSKNKKNLNNNLIKKITIIRDYLIYISLGILLLGFILYYIKQRKDHKSNWYIYTFIFGNRKCDYTNRT